MKEDAIIYQLAAEDVQTVAIETLGRELTEEEIYKLQDLIAEKIPWFEAISDAIQDSGLK
jgi:hypothetical protein